MNIAIFSDNFYPELGGIQDSILWLGKELGKRGHLVEFYVPRHPSEDFAIGGFPDEEISMGPRVTIRRLASIRVPSPTLQSRLILPTFLRWKTLQEFKPDIIHSQTFFTAGLEAIVAHKMLGVPLVGTNHWALAEFGHYTPFGDALFRTYSVKYVTWYYNHCERVSAPSQSVLDEMERAGLSRPNEVVSNPIDLDIFTPAPSATERKNLKAQFGFSPHTILYVGRLAKEKNIEDAIEALPFVVPSIPDICLAIAGHGSNAQPLRALAEKLGVSEHVKFLGSLDKPELRKVYQASDAFVIMSTSESQSMVLIQAMACGLPTLAARWRSLPEYVDEGKNGFLITPHDIQTLATKMIWLMKERVARQKMGRYAIKSVDRYSTSHITERWESIYERTIQEHRARS